MQFLYNKNSIDGRQFQTSADTTYQQNSRGDTVWLSAAPSDYHIIHSLLEMLVTSS